MADSLVGPYGDLGTAIYNEETHTWHFAKNPTRYFGLDLVGEHTEAASDETAELISKPQLRRELYATIPELHAEREAILNDLQISHSVVSALNRYDSSIGHRIVVSNGFHNAIKQTLRVMAYSTGSDVMICTLQYEKQGWNDSRNAWLHLPTTAGPHVIWKGPGSTVKQVCLTADTIGHQAMQPYMAVRLADRLVLLHYNLRSLTTDVFYQHHTTCSDAAFNPWSGRHYAVLDGAGNFEIWHIVGTSSEEVEMISQHNDPEIEESQEQGITDGWGRIAWITNSTTIVICSRRSVDLYSILAFKAQHEFRFQVGEGLIVDLLVHSKNLLLVLTTQHILAFDLATIQSRQVMKLRHHASPHDISLTLTCIPHENGLILLLRSKLSVLSLCYKVILKDSITLTGPSDCRRALQSRKSECIAIPITNVAMPDTKQGTTYNIYRQHNHGVFQVFHLCNDLQLRTDLVQVSTEDAWRMPATQWRKELHERTPKYVDDAFVVHDDNASSSFQGYARPISEFVQGHLDKPRQKIRQRRLDLTALVAALNHQPAEITMMHHALRHAATILEEQPEVCKSLLELEAHGSSVTDIEATDLQLQHLITSEAGKFLRRLPVFGDITSSASLAVNYTTCIADWITPLAAISGRIRLAKERLARQIAAEITLASHVFHTEVSEELEDAQSQVTASQQSLHHRFDDLNIAASALPTPSPSVTSSVISQYSYAKPNYLAGITTFTKPLPRSLSRTTQRVLRHWDIGADPETYDWQAYNLMISRQIEQEELESQLTEKERMRLQRRAERFLNRERREAAASQQQQLMSSQLPDLVVSASQSQPRQNILVSSQVVDASQPLPTRPSGKPVKKKRKQGF